MNHIIVGTAGHVDHGKTALVRALTGIDTDRLEEEKRRGISIDLGFAHLELGDYRIGFVDVPGHERFVKNMLAGAGGIDLLLFVVAADESIKPQTREHFEICRLLGLRKAVVALTKVDLVDRDIVDLVRLEVEELAAGSFLEGAPAIAVSSVTGEGLEELRRAIASVAASVDPKDASRLFRLPVDRVFSMRGFGTVITGTLISGSVQCDQEIELHPGGMKLRVRGVQVHGESVRRAFAGQRTAMNVTGVEPGDVRRGMVAAETGMFAAVHQIDSRLELLPSAKPLKHRAPVHLHSGTAEVEAEVRLLESLEPAKAGARPLVRLLTRESLLMIPGDRFIIRMFSPVITIGGGIVLDIAGPRRLSRLPTCERLRLLEAGSAADRIALLVRESRAGVSPQDLVGRTGLPVHEIVQVARDPRLVALGSPPQWLADRGWCTSTAARIVTLLGSFHRQHPLLPGMSKEELRTREFSGAPAFVVEALLAQNRDIVVEGENVRLRSHSLSLKQDEEKAVEQIERAFANAGLAVPATPEVISKCGVEPARARSLLQILLRDRKLVRVNDDLVFHHTAIVELRKSLAGRKGVRFSVPEFKEWTGVSRKYAIPLLEYLDRERVTRREGDLRVVL